MKKQIQISSKVIAILFSAIFLCSTTVRAGKKDSEGAAPAQVYSQAETADLVALAKATGDALGAGKQTEMLAKLKDLETAWDKKEKDLKPKDEATWTLLDKDLDKVISALRKKSDLEKGKVALESLLKGLEQATKP